MVSRIRIRNIIACILFLVTSTSAFDANTRLPFDSRPLVEVHSLDAVPKAVIDLLGWKRGGADGIADRLDKFNAAGAAGSDLPRRRFTTAGVSSAAVIVIYERAGSPPTYHAVGYTMTGTGWLEAGEWDVDPESSTLTWFLYEVDSARYGQRAQMYLESKRRYRVLARIDRTRPFQRTAPLRKSNLSDDEARDIQSLMAQVYPGALLNISGVVTGCYCEESQWCSDQVWVVPRDDVRTPGVLLSHIGGRWVIGPIQQWWLDRAKIEANTDLTRAQREDALYDQWKTFPECSRPTASGP